MMIAAGLLLAACATVRRHGAVETEWFLASAGFDARPADTTARLTDLATMPALGIVARSKDGQPVYTFADPDHCRCLYIGSGTAYADYERALMRLHARGYSVAGARRALAREWTPGMDWSLWGPW